MTKIRVLSEAHRTLVRKVTSSIDRDYTWAKYLGENKFGVSDTPTILATSATIDKLKHYMVEVEGLSKLEVDEGLEGYEIVDIQITRHLKDETN